MTAIPLDGLLTLFQTVNNLLLRSHYSLLLLYHCFLSQPWMLSPRGKIEMADRCFRASWGCVVFVTFAGMAHPAGRLAQAMVRQPTLSRLPGVMDNGPAHRGPVLCTDQMQANTF